MKLKTYQVIARDRVWHLTQRQARPPEKSELGCNTVCGVWANMKDGYERGVPTCATCLRVVVEYESKQPQPWADWTTEDVELEVASLFPSLVDAHAHPGVVDRFKYVPQPHFGVGSRRRRRGG